MNHRHFITPCGLKVLARKCYKDLQFIGFVKNKRIKCKFVNLRKSEDMVNVIKGLFTTFYIVKKKLVCKVSNKA